MIILVCPETIRYNLRNEEKTPKEDVEHLRHQNNFRSHTREESEETSIYLCTSTYIIKYIKFVIYKLGVTARSL